MKIRESFERRRGCGYRQVGGLYLVSDGPAGECGRFPVPVETCPTCGGGIKPARGWTWINGDVFKSTAPGCTSEVSTKHETCFGCVMSPSVTIGRAGLLWVGSMHYATPYDFATEARVAGISRRIAYVPAGFEVGQTVVFLGHRQAIACTCACDALEGGGSDLIESCALCDGAGAVPGLFAAWRPDRIERVVDENEKDEDLERSLARGIEPVIVRPIDPDLGFEVVQ